MRLPGRAVAGRKRKGVKTEVVAGPAQPAASQLLLASGKTVIPLAGGLFATADVIVTTDGAAPAPGEAVAGVINFSGQSLPYSIGKYPYRYRYLCRIRRRRVSHLSRFSVLTCLA